MVYASFIPHQCMPIEIKVLSASDAAALGRVAPDVFDYAVDGGAARAFLTDPRCHLVVALDDGLVVGMVSSLRYVHPDKPIPELWIDEVAVASSHHRRGIGKALMLATLDLGRTLGCSQAWVLTDRANHAALALYTSAGGTEPSDELVMFEFDLGNSASSDRAP